MKIRILLTADIDVMEGSDLDNLGDDNHIDIMEQVQKSLNTTTYTAIEQMDTTKYHPGWNEYKFNGTLVTSLKSNMLVDRLKDLLTVDMDIEDAWIDDENLEQA